jgi:hypothetical protein
LVAFELAGRVDANPNDLVAKQLCRDYRTAASAKRDAILRPRDRADNIADRLHLGGTATICNKAMPITNAYETDLPNTLVMKYIEFTFSLFSIFYGNLSVALGSVDDCGAACQESRSNVRRKWEVKVMPCWQKEKGS